VTHSISEILMRYRSEEAKEQRRDRISALLFLSGLMMALGVVTLIVIYVVGGVIGLVLYGLRIVNTLAPDDLSGLNACLAIA
jgi:hypothetical protein